MGFRDTAWALSPSRLRTSRAARLVYTFIGLPLDMIAEAADRATKARFPALCPEDALPYHSRDRGIRRGPLESATNFRARLRLWISSWRGAGVGRAMLDQIAGYLSPRQCKLRIWTPVGMVYTREVDGTFTVERVAAGLWDWDGNAALWARFWVVIYSISGSPWSAEGTWGDGSLWGDDGTWGSTATSEEVEAIRGIIFDWKPAPTAANVIVTFDAAAFAPTDTSPPLPDGDWNYWSNRDPDALYWDEVS